MNTVPSQRRVGRWRQGESEGEMEKVTAMVDTTGEVVKAKEVEELILPGFRFHPTDEELVGFYLRRKVEKKAVPIDIIKQVDIYKCDPWYLPRVSSVGDKEWYFFCLRGRKYKNSIRPNRVTGSGFWKATGIDRPVFSTSKGNDCIGLKKSLVYYRGIAGKGSKTDWMMHEFRLPADGTAGKSSSVSNGCIQESETWTICRIFRRTIPHKKNGPSRHVFSDSNPKTSSAESKGSDISYLEDTESNQSVITHFEGTKPNNSIINYLDDKSHLYACQWNSPAQEATSVTTYPNFFSSNSGDFMFDDGCWDELGRIVEFSVDPSLAHECKYTHTPSF